MIKTVKRKNTVAAKRRTENVTDLDGVVIRSTYNYAMFNTIVGNRDVKEKHVQELVDSMDRRHLANIVIINKEGKVIDGQHTVEASKRLGLPVNYIVMEDYGVDEIHILNTNTSNWKEIDFIQQHADLYKHGMKEYESYNRVITIVEQESFHYRVALYVLEGGKVAGNKEIISGELKIKHEDDETIVDRIDLLNECIGILGSKAKTSSFAQALVLAMQVPGFNRKTFIQKMKSGRSIILNAKTGREYMSLAMETAYNRGLKAENNISIKVQSDIIYKQIKRVGE